jgi:hypothetical protein
MGVTQSNRNLATYYYDRIRLIPVLPFTKTTYCLSNILKTASDEEIDFNNLVDHLFSEVVSNLVLIIYSIETTKSDWTYF